MTKQPLLLMVQTFTVESNGEDCEKWRVIDHNNHDDRKWLGNHCFWAFNNGRGIAAKPCPPGYERGNRGDGWPDEPDAN